MATRGPGQGGKGSKTVGSILGAAQLPMQKFTDALTGMREATETLIAPFEAMATAGEGFIKSIGGGDGFKGFMESAMAIDTMAASLQQATGRGTEYTTMAVGLQAQMTALGVSNEEASKTFETLHNGFSEFTLLAPKAQKAIAEQAAGFAKLGVSIEQTTANYNIFMKGMGMNRKEAEKANKEMAKLALSIGVAPKQMAKDFAAAAPTLARYGKSGVKVFNELAVQSKATGMSMSSLLNVAKGFDTFEEAAEKAGKLNAMLGGNLLNSIDMLTATESERIDMIRQSMAATGQSWDMLDRFQKKGLAGAVGISDMTEAMRLFGTEQASLDDLKEKADPAVVAQQNLTKAMEKGVSIASKFSAAFERIGNIIGRTLQPILKELANFMTGKKGLGAATGIFKSFAGGIRSVFKWFKQLSPETKDIIKSIATMAIKGIALGFAMSQVKAVAGPLMDLLTNPWAIIITGVMILYKNWGKLDKLWAKIVIKLKSMDKAILKFFDRNKDNKFISMLGTAYKWLKVKVPEALKGISEWFEKNKKPIGDFWDKWISGPLKKIWEDFSESKGIFRGGVGATIGRWWTAIKTKFDNIRDFLADLAIVLVDFHGGAIMQGLGKGITDPEREAKMFMLEREKKVHQRTGGTRDVKYSDALLFFQQLDMYQSAARSGGTQGAKDMKWWGKAMMQNPFYQAGFGRGFATQEYDWIQATRKLRTEQLTTAPMTPEQTRNFHEGGVVTAQPGENPMALNRILADKETVFRPDQLQMLAQVGFGGGGGTPAINIVLDLNGVKKQIAEIGSEKVKQLLDPRDELRVSIPSIEYS